MKGHILKVVVTTMLWMLCHVVQAGTVTYVYADPQGTPLAEADASGNITARFEYTPYGVSVSSMGAAPDGPGYTGHVNDPDTGLVYMQARYYDSEMGRFMSVDPVGLTPGDVFRLSRYAYANNNPIANTDPDGRECATGQSESDMPCAPPSSGPPPTPLRPPPPSPKAATNLATITVTAPGMPNVRPIAWGTVGEGLAGLVGGIRWFGPTIILGAVWPTTMGAAPCEMPGGPKCSVVYNDGAQPDEKDLTKLKERDGNRAAEEAGYDDAHDAKKGRGGGHVDIYKDKTTGRKWLWNGVPGGGKEEL